MGRPIRREGAGSIVAESVAGPVVRPAEVLEDLHQQPRARSVRDTPLHHLAAAQPGPGALVLTLCRRVVTRRPPWRQSVAASDPVAGVNGRVEQAQALFTALAWLSAAGVWTKALRRARSPHQRGATRSGGRPERAGVDELGNRKPGILPGVADSPGCQDSSFPVLRPGRRPRRARPGAGGCGRRSGELETWNTGIRAARRGACRRGPAAGPPECTRGAHSGGGHGLPMARWRASLAAAGMRLQRKPTPVLAKASTVWGWRGPSGRRAIDGTHALAAEDAGESNTRESDLPAPEHARPASAATGRR